MTESHSPGQLIVNDGTDFPKNMADCILANAGTPNEWTAIGIADDDGYAESVAYCHPSNAQLLSAAPDMLAALRECFRWSNDWPDDVIIQVQEAIAKATGASHD